METIWVNVDISSPLPTWAHWDLTCAMHPKGTNQLCLRECLDKWDEHVQKSDKQSGGRTLRHKNSNKQLSPVVKLRTLGQDESVSSTTTYKGFPDSSIGKESACNAGDPSSITGSGRSAGEWIYYPPQYSWASLVVQLIKNPPAMRETWVWSLGWENPLEKCCGLENSMDCIVHGVTKSQTQLSDFYFHHLQAV